MDLLEDPKFKIKYHKHKIRVKLWESDFMEKYGRKPSKNDIKGADTTIREAYKIYWELKTKALELSLTDVTFMEETEQDNSTNDTSLECSKTSDDQVCDGGNTSTQSVLSVKDNLLDNSSCNIKIGSKSFKDDIKVKKVESQGEMCSEKQSSVNDTSSTFQLSQQKFKTLSYSKRNPRKSASALKQQSSLKEDVNKSDNHLDKQDSGISDININLNGFDTLPSSKINLNMVSVKKEISSHATSTIQNIIKTNKSIHKKELNQGWLNRCTMDTDPSINLSLTNEVSENVDENLKFSECIDLPKENFIENTKEITKETTIHNKTVSDEEDYVCNSDSEQERKNKRIRNFNKINYNNDVQPAKKICVSNDLKTSCDTKIINKMEEKPSVDIDVKVQMKKPTKNIDKTKSYSKQPRQKLGTSVNRNIDERSTYENENTCDIKNNKSEISIDNMEVVEAMSCTVSTSNGSGNLISQYSDMLGQDKSTNNSSNEVSSSTYSKSNGDFKERAKNYNENFVRINLKKKVFVRGKKSFNYSKYKKNQWKQRKREAYGDRQNFKNYGKNADACDLKSEDGGLLPLCDGLDSDFPTIEEVDELFKLSSTEGTSKSVTSENRTLTYSNDTAAAEISSSNGLSSNENVQPETDILHTGEMLTNLQEVQPVYELEADGSLKDTPLEVWATLKKFGYNQFREGQERAIMRILSGQSTLVNLATGSGKSLCYQLPAYIYSTRSQCITLVVSPLVSLMEDQLVSMPDFLDAVCLHTNQTAKVREKNLAKLKEGNVTILLVSPETIVAGEKSSLLGKVMRDLPPIAFACIDEAHCISQWSHNFRPSYLMVCKILKQKFRVNVILGLTATVNKTASMGIVKLLTIEDGINGVISKKPLPDNLYLTVSHDHQRDEALVRLLKSPEFMKYNSIIVYCTRREECVRLAGLIRASLTEIGLHNKNIGNKKVPLSPVAEAYHAGLSAYRRKLVQAAFMNSETRIIVATVAFGMGINKADIRSVIHYNMPGSFESYVQEIGRAGRDGLPTHCHLFLYSKENHDEHELRRHVNAKGLDRRTIRLLLQKIFIPCLCRKKNELSDARCPGHEVAFPVDETVESLDISEEMIATLLCYLELHPKQFIKFLPSVYINAKIYCYSGPKFIKLAAQTSRPLAMAIALAMKKGTFNENSSTLEFSVIEVAAAMNCDSGIVKRDLSRLEYKNVYGKVQRTKISVKFDTLGFRVKAPGDFTNEELDEALDTLSERNQMQTTLYLRQLKLISTSVRKFSSPSVHQCFDLNEESHSKSEELKNTIRAYFEADDPVADVPLPSSETVLENEDEVVDDIRSLIISYKDNDFTGRSIARIFHGIQSPNYPALTWARCRFWRSHITKDFNRICQLAASEILKLK